jgi:valacyclovir hydrolase
MPYFDHAESHVYYEEEGSGIPVVLLPGWGGSIAEFDPVRTALAPNYRVIAIDLPGSGRSGPQPRTYTKTYLHDDASVLLSLLDHLGVGPAHLVGFSDGGEEALLMAALRPEMARSVFTWGSCAKLVAPPGMLDAMYNLIDSPIPPLQEFAGYMRQAYGEANARVMTQSASQALRALIEDGGDVSYSRLGNITCPVLLMTGEHDFFAPPSLVSPHTQQIARSEYVEATGAGHAVHHESPAFFMQTLAAWLARN